MLDLIIIVAIPCWVIYVIWLFFNSKRNQSNVSFQKEVSEKYYETYYDEEADITYIKKEPLEILKDENFEEKDD